MLPNLGDQLQQLDLKPVASISASFNGTGLDLVNYEGEIAIVADVANVSGTTPTADLKIQDSADNSSFADIVPAASFTQVTTVAGRQKMSLNKNELRRYVRVVATLGGTSPVYLISVNAVGMKRYADGA
jgi:hypothetical protein